MTNDPFWLLALYMRAQSKPSLGLLLCFGPIHFSLLNYVVVFVTMKRGKKGGDGDRQLLLCSDIFLSCSIAKAPQIFAGFY